MGKKRARAAGSAKPAASDLVLARGAGPQPELGEPLDDRIDYTDQHGVHWVVDAGR